MLKSIGGSISKLFDPATPANVRELQKRCPSASQKERAQTILARWKVIRDWRKAWESPSCRQRVVLEREKVAGLADVADENRRKFFEAATLVHDERAVLDFDSWLDQDMAQAAEEARALIIELNGKLAELITEEMTKLRARLQLVYSDYGHTVETDPSPEPLRAFERSHELALAAAEGRYSLSPWQVDLQLLEWL